MVIPNTDSYTGRTPRTSIALMIPFARARPALPSVSAAPSPWIRQMDTAINAFITPMTKPVRRKAVRFSMSRARKAPRSTELKEITSVDVDSPLIM